MRTPHNASARSFVSRRRYASSEHGIKPAVTPGAVHCRRMSTDPVARLAPHSDGSTWAVALGSNDNLCTQAVRTLEKVLTRLAWK